MNPITPRDISRFAAGEVTDDDEALRIMEAMAEDPGLTEIFDLLSDPDEFVVDLPELETTEMRAIRARIELLGRARLWPLVGNPLYQLDGPAALRTVSVSSRNSEELDCTIHRKDDTRDRFELEFAVPAGCVLLDVAFVQFDLPAAVDVTRRRVTSVQRWNGRLNQSPSETYALAADSLTAERGCDHYVEANGGFLDLSITGQDERTAFVSARRLSDSLPLPILFTGYRADGLPVHDARLLRQASEVFQELFVEETDEIISVEVRQLMVGQLGMLSPHDAAELLSHRRFILAATEPDTDDPNRHAFNITGEDMGRFITHPNTTLCLNVAEVGKEAE